MFGKIKTSAITAALSLMLLLSACGTAPQSSTPDASAPDDTTATRTVTTTLGAVEVPAQPQRVIATYNIGDVIALGIKPVATYDVSGTAFESEVAGLPVWKNFEAEEIMQFEPDLILVSNQDQYDIVSKIAPTVLVPFTEMSMEQRLTFLGEVLNKQEEAANALAHFSQKIEEAKQQLSDKDIGSKTFSLFEASGDSVWVFGDKWGRGGDLIYSHLGLKAPEIIQNEIIAKDQYRDLSLEVMGDYAGDYILFSGEIGALKDNPIWQALPAVQNGNVIPIDFDLFFNIDIYSSEVQLDYVMEALTKN